MIPLDEIKDLTATDRNTLLRECGRIAHGETMLLPTPQHVAVLVQHYRELAGEVEKL